MVCGGSVGRWRVWEAFGGAAGFGRSKERDTEELRLGMVDSTRDMEEGGDGRGILQAWRDGKGEEERRRAGGVAEVPAYWEEGRR